MELTGIQKQPLDIHVKRTVEPGASGRPVPATESKPTENVVNDPEVVVPANDLDNSEPSPSLSQRVERAVEQLEEFVQNSAKNNRIQFFVDDDSGKIIVRVIDKNTEEIIRQIPPEEFIRISKNLKPLQEAAKGLILDNQG